MNRSQFLQYVTEQKNRLIWPIGADGFGIRLFTLHFTTMCEAFGFEVVQTTPFLREVVAKKFSEAAEAEAYFRENPFVRAKWDEDLESIRALKHDTKDIIIGGAFGPLTVAMHMLGGAYALKQMVRNKAMVRAFIEVLTSYIIELAQEESACGADLFWVAEPVAVLLPPKLVEELCTEVYRRIFREIPMAGILHICGNTDKHMSSFADWGMAAISIDFCCSLPAAIETAKEQFVVMGNLDPMLLRDASKEEIIAATREMVRSTGDCRYVILSTGCAVAPDTPWENIQCWAAACKEMEMWRA